MGPQNLQKMQQEAKSKRAEKERKKKQAEDIEEMVFPLGYRVLFGYNPLFDIPQS